MNAQNRFSLMMDIVLDERRIAEEMARRLSCSSTISPVSIATSVPDPIAIPTSAAAIAGASLIPSPIMVTTLPLPFSRSIS
ncbi:hypothetical protein D3C71_1843900 [compost metagenome]